MLDPSAELLVTLPELARPSVSPDGDRVAYFDNTSGRNEVWVLNLTTGARGQWSDANVPDHTAWPLRWAADGEQIYVHVDGAGDEENDLHALDADGTLSSVLERTGQTNLHDVDPNGETLLVTSTHERGMQAYLYDLHAESLHRLTDHDAAVWEAVLSPDGERVAYATNDRNGAAGERHGHNRDIYLVDASGSSPRRLDVSEFGSETVPVDWGPDGDRLLLSDDAPGTERSGVYDVREGAVHWYDDEGVVESPAMFTPDGDRFLVERAHEATVTPTVYHVASGEKRPLAADGGVAEFGWRCNRVVDADRVLLTYSTPTRPTELLVYDLASDTSTIAFSREFDAIDRDDFHDVEYLRVESDGVPETRQAAIEHEPRMALEIGALLYDPDRRPAPLIVKPHGGPRRQDRREFNRRVQFLLELGYAVLQVNYRGSAGRGRAFTEALLGDFGGAEQGDIATLTEHVVRTRDWIDEDRVGVYGGSYGGYSTYWQLVQYPDLYDAGVAINGMTDLLDAYERAPPNYRTDYFERYLGDPAENAERYRERSPVTHAGHLEAPLLVFHGVNDPRVPVSQARRLRDALIDAGFAEGADGDFEYHELGERGHNSSDVEGRIRIARLFAEFLTRRL